MIVIPEQTDVNPNNDAPEDHPDLREALKRCSPATYYAACKFRQTGDGEYLKTVILGVIERFVERDLRTKLEEPSDALLLREDLGLDSLTMMEIVMVAEEVLPLSITNEELTRLRSLGDVQAFFQRKVREGRLSPKPAHVVSPTAGSPEAAPVPAAPAT